MGLAEVLVTMFIFSFVLVAILNLLDTSTKVAANDTERPLAVREAQVGLHRMTREIRQADSVSSAFYSEVQFNVTINNVRWQVRYDCSQTVSGTSFHRCTRQAAPVGVTLSEENAPRIVVIDRVLNEVTPADPVFYDFTPDPTNVETNPQQDKPKFFRVKIKVPAAGGRNNLPGNGGYKHSVVLDDGVYMRNLNLSG